jgi:transcriptional regulator of nitric oxide reductase
MPSVRVYQKKQIRLDRLSFRQTQMFKVGNVGVAVVKNRLAAAQGPTDSAAKSLTKRYAIWKTKIGKGNRRNLMLTGDMLRNFQVRTVSENKAKASTSTRKDRIKAWITNKIEPWITFSPRNRNAVLDAMNRILQESKARLLVEKSLGGKQL